ncbi:hypothetical protein PVL29_013711 [Vitis rotundifolia]|uniref:Uncharacterized protein n=1 Tax=Vitis rotundifolia TaxID=103349 RepID=A0AA38ZNL5_VITRO|nr:hypothetical protein PVL29_013711 [Vitis rotundifolia]
MHRVSKGAPESILNLEHNKSEIECTVHAMIDKFVDRGLRSLLVAYREVPDGMRKAWEVYGNLLATCLSSTHLDMIVQIQ